MESLRFDLSWPINTPPSEASILKCTGPRKIRLNELQRVVNLKQGLVGDWKGKYPSYVCLSCPEVDGQRPHLELHLETKDGCMTLERIMSAICEAYKGCAVEGLYLEQFAWGILL